MKTKTKTVELTTAESNFLLNQFIAKFNPESRIRLIRANYLEHGGDLRVLWNRLQRDRGWKIYTKVMGDQTEKLTAVFKELEAQRDRLLTPVNTAEECLRWWMEVYIPNDPVSQTLFSEMTTKVWEFFNQISFSGCVPETRQAYPTIRARQKYGEGNLLNELRMVIPLVRPLEGVRIFGISDEDCSASGTWTLQVDDQNLERARFHLVRYGRREEKPWMTLEGAVTTLLAKHNNND